MADILEIPRDEFVRLWFGSFHGRNTGVFPTPQDNILYICRELGKNCGDSPVEKAATIRLTYTLSAMTPRPGTLETLSRLKSKGYRTGLISDCSGEIPIVWTDTSLAPLIDVAIFSCVVRMKKPDPRIYAMATERLKAKPQECLYVGDGGSNELTGARQAGMDPVLVRDPDESIDAHFVDREDTWDGPVISSISEVLNLI
jgi:putative hydrolase of the HAD superfamily